jgi:hypothetical protein
MCSNERTYIINPLEELFIIMRGGIEQLRRIKFVCFHFVYITPCGWLSWRRKEVKNHYHTNLILFMKIFADNVAFIVIEDLIHYAHINGVQQQTENRKYFMRLSYIFFVFS